MKKIIALILLITLLLFAEEKALYNPAKTGEIKYEHINESSALVKSRQYPDAYWTLNDSGDEARIFAIHRNGEAIIPLWAKDFYKGITIPNAVNIDWEDIAITNDNQLVIGACGNNGNARKDLAIYLLDEPNPYEIHSSRASKRIDFFYPDQKAFPPQKELRNFDCEAVFSSGHKIYFLTKHRGNLYTKLYSLDLRHDYQKAVELTFISKFKIDGMVTAADISKDGKKLAVLTYYKLWLFERDSKDDNFFSAKSKYLELNSELTKQCEAITFNEEKSELILTNEQRDVYSIPLRDFN